MKPILILQHLERGDVPLFMEAVAPLGVHTITLRPDRGETLPKPSQLDRYSGLCVCGGTQSANDDLDWIGQELDLIQEAERRELPVIGHCLGGQLISKALGGTVTRHHGEEYGWHELLSTRNDTAHDWLGEEVHEFVAMQWHSDTFTIPPGATQILYGEHCHPQAFVKGNMLGMQFHVEMVKSSVLYWALDLAHDAPEPSDMAQTPEQILAELDTNISVSRALGQRLYARWLETLRI